MKCRKFREIMFLVVDDEADQELLISVRRHSSHCPECAAEMDYTQRFVAVLRKRCVRATAPRGLRRRILTSFPHRSDEL